MRHAHVFFLLASLAGAPVAHAAQKAKPAAVKKLDQVRPAKPVENKLPELLKTETNYGQTKKLWKMASGNEITTTSSTNNVGEFVAEGARFKRTVRVAGSYGAARETEDKQRGLTDARTFKPVAKPSIYRRQMLEKGYELVLYRDVANKTHGVVIDQRNGFQEKELSEAEVTLAMNGRYVHK